MGVKAPTSGMARILTTRRIFSIITGGRCITNSLTTSWTGRVVAARESVGEGASEGTGQLRRQPAKKSQYSDLNSLT